MFRLDLVARTFVECNGTSADGPVIKASANNVDARMIADKAWTTGGISLTRCGKFPMWSAGGA